MPLHAWCTACSSPPLSPPAAEISAPGLCITVGRHPSAGFSVLPLDSSSAFSSSPAFSTCASSLSSSSSSFSSSRTGPPPPHPAKIRYSSHKEKNTSSALASAATAAAAAGAMAITSSPFMEPMNSNSSNAGNSSNKANSSTGYRLCASDRLTEVPKSRHIWFVTGPAGCGKSTVAKFLAEELALPYIEGDDFHTSANKAKMAAGDPLTDADRWDWLIRLRNAASASLVDDASTASSPSSSRSSSPSPSPSSSTSSSPSPPPSPSLSPSAKPQHHQHHHHHHHHQLDHLDHHRSCVVTCSALRRRYRDVLRMPVYFSADVAVHFVFLDASEAELQARVAQRRGHYMKSGMVHSQFEALEFPDKVECAKDVIVVDCARRQADVEEGCLRAVQDVLARSLPVAK